MKRIMFHLSHEDKFGKFKSIVIASPNTDVFVSLYTIIESLCTLT